MAGAGRSTAWGGVTAESVASPSPNQGVQATPYSVRSVRRASGMEECGNTSGIQVPDEPLERRS